MTQKRHIPLRERLQKSYRNSKSTRDFKSLLSFELSCKIRLLSTLQREGRSNPALSARMVYLENVIIRQHEKDQRIKHIFLQVLVLIAVLDYYLG
jgi:hypothetical protein